MDATTDRPRLRIALVYDALVPYCAGGAERRFFELGTRLAARHDVHYVTWRFWGHEPSIVRDGMTLHGIGEPRGFYGSDGKRTIREALEFAARLPATLARLPVDVIDISATPYLPLYAAWATTRLTRTPLVATWHEFWGDHWTAYLPDRPVVARIARLAEKWARPLADRRIAVSAFTAGRLAAGRPDRWPVEVVGNGVNGRALASAKRDPERSDVLFVGRLIDEKRVDLLVRAVAELSVRYPALRCLIAGDGPEAARLAALAVELGVEDRVRFLGPVPDERIPALMRASRILVMPSVREGYGISVVEGQACGLVPVVVRSPLSAAPELVSDGVDGVICEPTAGGIAEALNGLLVDEPLRRRMARAAEGAAAGRGWDARATEMEAVYLKLVAARGPRRSRGGLRRPSAPDVVPAPGRTTAEPARQLGERPW